MKKDIAIHKKTHQETLNSAMAMGFSRPVAKFLANRIKDPESLEDIVRPSLKKSLPSMSVYPDMIKAARRLAQAIQEKQEILLAVDFDADGINAGAVLFRGLTESFSMPQGKVRVMISHRAKWGYGFTLKAVNHIVEGGGIPDLLITADQGSANGEEIHLLRGLGMIQGKKVDVIVTDHHEIPEDGYPKQDDVAAFVNPQRDSSLPDSLRDICGATVAWFLLIATYQVMEKSLKPEISSLIKRKIYRLVSHCAIATVADVMSLAHPLNRAICLEGFRFINEDMHPAWVKLREVNQGKPIDEEFVGFTLAPLINAASRMGLSGEEALDFMVTSSASDAEDRYAKLESVNNQRKEVGRDMLEKALKVAQEAIEQGKKALVVYLRDGTPGIVGIVAGRLKEEFNLPAIVLSPSDGGILTGSARSIEGLNIRECLEEVYAYRPDLIERFGGHPQAAGMLVREECLVEFSESLNKIVTRKLNGKDTHPVLEVDFHLGGSSSEILSIEDVMQLEKLKPFGQGFEPPLALIEGMVTELRPVGKEKKLHLKLTLDSGSERYDSIWFFARNTEAESWPVCRGVKAKVIASPGINSYRGTSNLQFRVINRGVT